MNRCLTQDLVRLPKLAVLALQLLQAPLLIQACALHGDLLSLSEPHPLTQRLNGATDLLRHTPDRRPLRLVILLLLQHQPHGALPNLTRVPTLLTHEPHPLKERTLRESRDGSLPPPLPHLLMRPQTTRMLVRSTSGGRGKPIFGTS